jgi:hypothetical protein
MLASNLTAVIYRVGSAILPNDAKIIDRVDRRMDWRKPDKSNGDSDPYLRVHHDCAPHIEAQPESESNSTVRELWNVVASISYHLKEGMPFNVPRDAPIDRA